MIIGLLGGKGSGKNTAAAYLAQAYGATVYAIANELKELLRIVFDLSEDQLHGTQAQKETIDPRWGLSPRQMMERQGDALRRVYGNDFQIQRLLWQILAEAPNLAVISDVRYKHEASAVSSRGIVWRMHYAPSLYRWPSAHSSEAEWMFPSVDLEVHPVVPGISELHATIDEACEAFDIRRKRAFL